MGTEHFIPTSVLYTGTGVSNASRLLDSDTSDYATVDGVDSGVTEPTISGTLMEDTTVTAVFEKIETSKIYCGTKKVSVYCGIKKYQYTVVQKN